MNIQFNLFPNGHHHALTMSFDDGRIYDRKLIEIFNHYGIKGTFHLNSGFLSKPGYVQKEELTTLYQGHEIACHTVSHPHLTQLAPSSCITEVIEDKKTLEQLCGYPIRGMSLPFGDYDENTLQMIKSCGIEYVRTVQSTKKYQPPKRWLEWHPTIHLRQDDPLLWEKFIENRFEEMRLLYVWGHSYEFNDNDTWDMIEAFCQRAAANPDIWFATNIEIKEYLDAVKMLAVSADGHMIYNPSGIDVYVSVDHQPVCVKARQIWIYKQEKAGCSSI